MESVANSLDGCVLTIGNFDGVHLGHREILASARRIADKLSLKVTAMTFDPPPDLVLRPADVPERLTLVEDKSAMLFNAGADFVVIAKSDEQLLNLSANEFIEQVIVGKFHPKHIVEGPDFFFGKGRIGDVSLLTAAGEQHGFRMHEVPPVSLEFPPSQQKISSTLIRNFLLSGKITDANRCLGRNFSLRGTIISGRGHGRMLDFPTANINAGQQIIPADGIYIGRATLDGIKKNFPAAISIGVKPTFAHFENERTIEAHLIGASGDFYNRRMKLEFIRFIREQKKFDSPQALKEQIAKDVFYVKEHVKKYAKKNVKEQE